MLNETYICFRAQKRDINILMSGLFYAVFEIFDTNRNLLILNVESC